MSQEDKEQLYELGDKLYGIGKDTIDALASEEALEKYQKIFSQLSETTAAALTNTVSTGAVGKFNAMVEAYEGKVSVSQPTEADLKGYNEILSAYAGLTNEEKSQVDLFMFDKMLHLILDREKQVSIQNNPDVASYNKQHCINAEVAAENILGAVGYAAYFSEAKELYTVMNDSKKTADEKFEAYKSANQYACIYSDLWYSSYASFYYKLDSSNIGKNFMKLAQEYGKLYLAEDPFTETAPTVPSKPNKNDYSLGEDDPAYIEAYNTYMAGSKAKAEYDCRKNMHTAACNIKGVQKAEGAASEFAGLADFMKAAVAAVQKNSKIRGKAYSLGVDPDKSDAFLVMFRWLYGELTSAQNSKAIQTAVDASTLSSMQKTVVKGALSTVLKISPDTALLALINVAAPPIPDFSGALPGIHLPGIGSVRPRAGGILPSIGDGLSKVFGGLFSGGKKNTTAKTNTNAANSGKTQTGNPNVPKTGGAAVSLFVLAATAGIAAGAVLLKKKTDSDQD